jgi:hypothetical protein
MDETIFTVVPSDSIEISFEDFIPLFVSNQFKKLKLVRTKKMIYALILGVIYSMFILLCIYVLSLFTYVYFQEGMYIPFLIILSITLLFVRIFVIFFSQGVIYPLFLLMGNLDLESNTVEITDYNHIQESLFLSYKIGFITGLKIRPPSILEIKIMESKVGYSLVVFLDDRHQIQYPLGRII